MAKRVLFLLWWRLTGLFFPSRWLFLTYDDQTLTDGGGNQALRITAIKALATLFNIGYHHTPISRIDNHGVAYLADEQIDRSRLADWNNLVAFESVILIPSSAVTLSVRNLRLSQLFQLRRLSAARKQSIVVSITDPFPVSDFFPGSYSLVTSNRLCNHSGVRSRLPLRIALHVRRGDLMWTHSERLLPITYYLGVALRVVQILESLNIQYVCELYSEELVSSISLQSSCLCVLPELEAAVVSGPESSDLQVLDAIPHLVKFINYDPLVSIRRMASADIFVTSRSAFSYLAAINNHEGIVVYHPFWHPPLQGWIRSEQDLLFSEALFRRRLRKRMLSTC